MKNIFSTLIAPSVLAAATVAIAGTSFSAAQAAATPTAPTIKSSISYSATGTNTYQGANRALSASVLFNYLSNGMLEVKLSNTGPGAIAPSDILTSVFWDYDGSPLNLSLLSVTAPTVIKNNVVTGTNVNLTTSKPGEWQYKATTATAGLGGNISSSGATSVSQQYGLGTAGLGIFQGGTGQQFNYGIVSSIGSSANNAVKGGSFVDDYATFVFSGLASNFDVNKIDNIRFQYGTNLAETSITPKKKKVPEPTTIPALGLFAIGVLKLTTKNKKLVSQS
jgi:hypothetical protein